MQLGLALSPINLSLRAPGLPDLFPDGEFNSPAAWSHGTAWSIANGQAVFVTGQAGSPLTPVPAVPVVGGSQYRLIVNSATPKVDPNGGFISLWDSTLVTNLSGWVKIYEGINTFLFTPASDHASVVINSSSGNGYYTLNSVKLEKVT